MSINDDDMIAQTDVLTKIEVGGCFADECAVGQERQWVVDATTFGAMREGVEFDILEALTCHARKQRSTVNIFSSSSTISFLAVLWNSMRAGHWLYVLSML